MTRMTHTVLFFLCQERNKLLIIVIISTGAFPIGSTYKSYHRLGQRSRKGMTLFFDDIDYRPIFLSIILKITYAIPTMITKTNNALNPILSHPPYWLCRGMVYFLFNQELINNYCSNLYIGIF